MTKKRMYHAVYEVGPVAMMIDEVETIINETHAAPVIGAPDKAAYMIDTSQPGWEDFKSFFNTTAFRVGDLVPVANEKKQELIERLGDRIASAKQLSIYTDSGVQVCGNDLGSVDKKLVV